MPRSLNRKSNRVYVLSKEFREWSTRTEMLERKSYLLVTGTKGFSDCLLHLNFGAAKIEPGTI
jgi:hypothetical protein